LLRQVLVGAQVYPGTSPIERRPKGFKIVGGGPPAQAEIDARSAFDRRAAPFVRRDFFDDDRSTLLSARWSRKSVAVDFGVTRIVDNHWGVHALIRRDLFVGADAV
jgi:hypothetical protein